MLYKKLFFAVIAAVKCLCATDFIFPSYSESDSSHYIEEIKSQYVGVTDQNIDVLQKTLDSLVQEQKWQAALAKAEEILVAAQNKSDTLIDIALFCHNAKKHAKRKAYEYRRLQLTATYYAFINSTTDLQKAKSLILYALINSEEHADQNILNSAHNLCNFELIIKSDERFKELLKFEFVKYSIEESADSATLHIKFSHHLDCKQPENYIEISPKSDGYISCSLNEITVSGLEPGKEYTVKIRPGLKSIYDEKIEDAKEINFFVKDLTPRISLSPRAYVYPQQEKINIPISVSNIDDATVTLYHVPERQVITKKGEILGEYFNEESLEKVFTTTLHFDGNKTPNKTIVKNIDISQATPDIKPGLYVLSAQQKGSFSSYGYDREKATQWFTVTDIGLSTYDSEKSFIVQARSFATAKPIKGIQLELVAKNNEILATTKTDSDGFAEFPKELMLGKAGKSPACIFANDTKLGFCVLFLNKPAFDFSDRGVKGRTIINDYDAMVFTERGIYRPEEPVNIGIVLKDATGQEVAPTPLTVLYKTPKGIEIKRETLKGNELGTYSTTFILPNDSTTGMWMAEVYIDPTQKPVGHINFRVDDFSPNKMDLSLKTTKKFAKLGETIDSSLTAYYLYGAEVESRKTILEGKINPDPTPFKKWSEFCFGNENEKFTSTLLGAIDAEIIKGKAEYKVSVPQNLSSSLPLKIELSTRLVDTAASQSAAASLLLLTKPYVVGVKESENSSSDNIELEIIAVDSEGNLVESEELQYNFYKSNAIYQWFKEYSSWSYQRIYQDTLLDKGKLRTKSDNPIAVKIKAEKGETYVFEIKNKEEIVAKYRIGKQYFSKADRPDSIVITPESEVVKLGDHAILKVKVPFAGEATIISGLNSVILKDTAHFDEGVNIVKIPTDESWGSGAYVMISLVRPLNKKTGNIKSKRAVGVQWVKIDSEKHNLNVNFELPKTIKPKSQLTIPIELEGIKDTPAKVMLAVVDEGVLGLTAFKTPNPLEFFFGQKQLGIEMRDIYGYIIDPVDAHTIDMRSGGDALMLRKGAFIPKMHEKVLSFFDGNININNQGKAEIVVDIPAFFGKVKVYALAFAKGKMGMQESSVIVKDNLIVDINAPTFLTMGDKTQANIRFENTTDKPFEAIININAEKALKTNSRKIELNLKPKEQQIVPIEIEANQVGEGKMHITADGKDIAYDNSFAIDVRSPLQPLMSSQQFKVEPKETKIITSNDLLKDMLTTKTMATAYVTTQGPWNTGKIMQWLLQYPFGCTQQVISKGFAALYAMQQYKKDDEKNSKHNEHKRACYTVIEMLNERQLSNGGWSMWTNDVVDYNITAFAIEFLLHAKNNNLNVPKHVLAKAITAIHRESDNFNRYIKNNEKTTAAWLVKLCAQTKEFDTSTIRYCFDNFFEKCDSAIAKALFVATVAHIQDLARLSQGIKALKDAIAKGISVEDSVAIAAHLAPYTNIESVKEVVNSVAEALTKISQESIERFNTQTLSMVLKAQFEKISDNKNNKLKVKINDETITDQSATHFYTTDSVKDIKITNNGEEAVWLFTNTYGIPKQESATKEEHHVKVERKLFDISGQIIEKEHIKLGDRVVVVLEITIDKEKAKNTGYWLISEWLTAGLSHSSVFAKYEWLQDLSTLSLEQKRHDRYVASFKTKPHQNTVKIAYEVIATALGEFIQPGIYVENMLNPALFATYEPTKMVIKKSR